MPAKQISLPHPTIGDVNARIEQYDREHKTVQQALAKLFGLYRDNSELENVLLKVVTLNSLYATNIYATYQVAEHIHQLNIDGQLDQLLKDGRPDAVTKIARVQLGEKEFNFYSFATKYCSWHSPEAYPIYDSYVEWLLWKYRKQHEFATYTRNDTGDYVQFREIVVKFQEFYGLSTYHFKDIDKFLWLSSREYYSQLRNNSFG